MAKLRQLLKTWLAWAAAAFAHRPGRKARAGSQLQALRERLLSSASPKAKILLVRMDPRVGEALLTTPLFSALADRAEVYLLTHPRCADLLTGSEGLRGIFTYPRRASPHALPWFSLRKQHFDAVVNCTNWTAPSLTASLVCRFIARRAVLLGPAQGPQRALHDVAIPPRKDTESEVLQRLHYLSPLGVENANPRLHVRNFESTPALDHWLGEQGSAASVVLNPGGRLAYRRVPLETFVAIARVALQLGRRPWVTWGPTEKPLAEAIVGAVPGAVLAPSTSLSELAVLMSRAGMTACNNTGPMHLSVALQVPTFALFFQISMARWGHAYAPHHMVDLSPLQASPGEMARFAGERFAGWLRLLREP